MTTSLPAICYHGGACRTRLGKCSSVLFSALRDGLAHQYSSHRIVLDQQEIRVSFTWKDPLHLRIIGARSRDGHLYTVPLSQNDARWPRLCVDAETLWSDLDALFYELEH